MELLANIIVLGNAIVISRAFNNVQFSSSDPKLITYLIGNLSLLVVITLCFWALHGFSRIMETTNAFWVRKNYKEEMMAKVLQLPLEWHHNHHSGETIDKINKAGEALFAFSSTTFMINNSLVKIFGSLIAIFIFDPWAALIAVGVAALALFSMLKFDAMLQKAFFKIHAFENHLASGIHDYLTNIFSIITLRLENRVTREIRERSEKAFPDFKKNTKVTEVKWFTIGFFTSVMTFIVLSLNAYLSFRHTGIIIIGTLFALYTYLQNIGGVFSNFAYQYGKIVEQDTALRAAEIINEAYEKINHEEYPSLPADWHTLEIRNLSFSYHQEKKEGEPESKKHLDEVDLTIVRNQKIAFIGESGSGKSTALALLRGLYKPNIVEMWCDGNLLSGGMGALYHQVTLIPQEPELFNSTVEDNITMDIPTHSNNIQRVMDIAQFQSVLTRLPDGLNTNVMEKGVSLSGGEKQRLALARGLLAGWNSDFVFLDEPTSSVDFTNEMKIYENILLAFKDTTVISTVHNLALLKYFDSIYLFGNGKVIARGNFDELKSHPSFNILWENYNKSLK